LSNEKAKIKRKLDKICCGKMGSISIEMDAKLFVKIRERENELFGILF